MRSNFLHRPIGIGVQGLADVFAQMDIPFHSATAVGVNKLIFETIYHAALERSNELAISRKDDMLKLRNLNKYDEKYQIDIFESDARECRTYKENLSDEIRAILQRVSPIRAEIDITDDNVAGAYSSFVGSPASKGILQFDMWGVAPSPPDTIGPRSEGAASKTTVLRNSLLLAPMPTASTSQILGQQRVLRAMYDVQPVHAAEPWPVIM